MVRIKGRFCSGVKKITGCKWLREEEKISSQEEGQSDGMDDDFGTVIRGTWRQPQHFLDYASFFPATWIIGIFWQNEFECDGFGNHEGVYFRDARNAADAAALCRLLRPLLSSSYQPPVYG